MSTYNFLFLNSKRTHVRRSFQGAFLLWGFDQATGRTQELAGHFSNSRRSVHGQGEEAAQVHGLSVPVQVQGMYVRQALR